MKRISQLIEVAFALCALALVVAFLVYAFRSHSDGAAAWVQAVGSIAAIWAAYRISDREAAIQRRIAKEEAAAMLDQRKMTVAELMEHLASLCHRLGVNVDAAAIGYIDVTFYYRSSEFTFSIKSLESIDLIELHSPNLVRGIIGMVNEAGAAQELMDRSLEAKIKPPLMHIKNHCQNAERSYARAMHLVGIVPNQLYTPFLPEEEFDDDVPKSW
ncbi:hypothetical protein SY91_02141 [Burkholderia cenocepacia]|uniref:hypothetical protein n=1 Tax=Burkholderia cenocepacia TaxID=95486 RepID=UPI00163D0F50|nr:hypothetical protein [Burkholderia cenocepacia]QND94731.1 hypothetical protein SY91_02141 [Burkholderia cenocepacia]